MLNLEFGNKNEFARIQTNNHFITPTSWRRREILI